MGILDAAAKAAKVIAGGAAVAGAAGVAVDLASTATANKMTAQQSKSESHNQVSAVNKQGIAQTTGSPEYRDAPPTAKKSPTKRVNSPNSDSGVNISDLINRLDSLQQTVDDNKNKTNSLVQLEQAKSRLSQKQGIVGQGRVPNISSLYLNGMGGNVNEHPLTTLFKSSVVATAPVLATLLGAGLFKYFTDNKQKLDDVLGGKDKKGPNTDQFAQSASNMLNPLGGLASASGWKKFGDALGNAKENISNIVLSDKRYPMRQAINGMGELKAGYHAVLNANKMSATYYKEVGMLTKFVNQLKPLSKALPIISTALAFLDPVIAAFHAGKIDDETKKQFLGSIGSILGGSAGIEIGAVVGGAVGTAFFPGIGSAIGLIMGGLTGYALSSYGELLAETLWDVLTHKISPSRALQILTADVAKNLATDVRNVATGTVNLAAASYNALTGNANKPNMTGQRSPVLQNNKPTISSGSNKPKTLNETLIERIKRHEGLRLKSYWDVKGWSIGYGHQSSDINETTRWTAAQAEEALKNDVANVISFVNEKFPWVNSLDQERRNVLYEMAYQLGVYGLSKFKKTLKLISQGKFVEAADQMKKSLWAQQTPERAAELASIIGDGKGGPSPIPAKGPATMKADVGSGTISQGLFAGIDAGIFNDAFQRLGTYQGKGHGLYETSNPKVVVVPVQQQARAQQPSKPNVMTNSSAGTKSGDVDHVDSPIMAMLGYDLHFGVINHNA